MKLEKLSTAISVIALLGLSNGNLASAAPFNITTTVNAPAGWTENTHSVITPETSTTPSYTEGTSTTTFEEIYTPPQPGVDGLYELYSHTTTPITEYSDQSQTTSIQHSATQNSQSSTSFTYTISGTLHPTEALINNGIGSLTFDMGMDLTNSGDLVDTTTFGSLTFNTGYTGAGGYSNSSFTFLESTPLNLSLGNTFNLNFSVQDRPIYFEAIYEINDLNNILSGPTDPYTVDNLWLSVDTSLLEQTFVSTYDSPVQTELLVSNVIPAPAPVPVPAAAWLFGSGLLVLIGAARRKKTNH